MQKIITKPHLFFWALIPLMAICAFIFKDSLLRISYYNGVLDIKFRFLFLFSAIFFLLIGFNYYSLQWIQKFPKKWLSIAHILLQSIAILILVYYASVIDQTSSANDVEQLNMYFFFAFVLFLLATLVHLVNFFSALLLKKSV